MPRSPQLKMTYLQLAKVYHPDTVPPEAPPEARKLKEDILSLLNEAFAALNDERQRLEYIDELEAREQVGDLDVEAILAAEEDFQRATLLAKALQVWRGAGPARELHRPEPQGGRVLRLARLLPLLRGLGQAGAPERGAGRSPARALGIESPKCSVAWLFQGQVFKLLNETAHAKQAFQKTLELDPANVEAQRELRLYEQLANSSRVEPAAGAGPAPLEHPSCSCAERVETGCRCEPAKQMRPYRRAT